MTVVKVQHVVEIQSIIIDKIVLDVNVTIRSKTTEEHVFKDKELRKIKNIVDWKKERLKSNNSIALENTNLKKRAIHIHGRMEHNLVGYTNYYFYKKHTNLRR